MTTVSAIRKKCGFFEASYSIQLSYGCASVQVANFIALHRNTDNDFRAHSLSLNSPEKPPFKPCELWEICGDHLRASHRIPA
jgi:hypothetical protein